MSCSKVGFVAKEGCRKLRRLSEAHADDPILSKRLTISMDKQFLFTDYQNFPKRPRFFSHWTLHALSG